LRDDVLKFGLYRDEFHEVSYSLTVQPFDGKSTDPTFPFLCYAGAIVIGLLYPRHLAFLLFLPLAVAAPSPTPPSLTPAVSGPYHVEGAQLLDSRGRPYRIQGTRLAPVTSSDTDIKGAPGEFGSLSATTIVTIRQRLNMNAVRLPVDSALYLQDPAFRKRTRTVVQTANHLELLVILEAEADSPAFWTAIATDFRGNPNVFFALPTALAGDAAQCAVDAIRAAGAAQPILAGDERVKDPNLVMQVAPRYAGPPDELDRIARLAETVPVIAGGMDPELFTDSAECQAFPADPADATALIERRLTFFDQHNISWTLSSYEPGKLISDYRYLNGTRLDRGWTCSRQTPDRAVGPGLLVLSHLWKTTPNGLFPVNCMLGGFVVARNAVVSTYGPTLADHKQDHRPGTYPYTLGGVSIRVTDSKGVSRLAPLLYAGGGWQIISCVVPAASAKGPADVTVVRKDGSTTTGSIVVTDVAPGLWTKNMESRGEVAGQVTVRFPDGKVRTSEASTCGKNGCRAIPIPLSTNTTTTVRMLGTGFRYVHGHGRVQVTIAGRIAKVVSFGPDPSTPYNDQLTVEIPNALKGAGDVDMWFTVDGVLSNVVRLNLGKV